MVPPNINTLPFDDVDRDQFESLYDEEDLDVDKQIKSLRNCVKKRDRKALLEKITIGSYLSGSASALEIRDDMVGIAPALAEFVIGHIIVTDDVDSQNPSYKMLAKAANGVSEAYMFSQAMKGDTEEWTDKEKYRHDVEAALVLREVAAGRHYFWGQPIETARRAYQPHDEVMKKYLGFNINSAIYFVKYIEKILRSALERIMEPVYESDIDLYSSGDSIDGLQEFIEDEGRIPRPRDLPDQQEDARKIEKIHELIGENTELLWLPESTLIKNLPDEKDKNEFQSFLDRFSVELGKWEHPMGPDFWSVDDLNPIRLHPYIRRDNKILVPHVGVPRRALMNTFYYDLIQIDSYQGEFGQKWGDYIEEWTYDSLLNLFSESDILLNPSYKTDTGATNEFTDVIVDAGDCLILFECKAAKLNIDTRSGDFEALEKDLEKGVGKATSQLRDSISILKSANEPIDFETSDRSYSYDPEKNYDIIPIVVLGEQYDSISTNYFDIATEEVPFTPYVVDVMNLEIICMAIKSSKEFIGYVNGRVSQIQNNEFLSVDETDYLGLFLEDEVGFPDFPNGHMQLRDFSHVVGEAIDHKYGP